jgi:hypothetical protein
MSHIENDLVKAIVSVCQARGRGVAVASGGGTLSGLTLTNEPEVTFQCAGDREVILIPNVVIAGLGYQVDILAAVVGETRVVVECDGHDWHERTKQQASYDRARDRALLRIGLPTLRFTGSDIHRDANQCACEVLDTLDALRAWQGRP